MSQKLDTPITKSATGKDGAVELEVEVEPSPHGDVLGAAADAVAISDALAAEAARARWKRVRVKLRAASAFNSTRYGQSHSEALARRAARQNWRRAGVKLLAASYFRRAGRQRALSNESKADGAATAAAYGQSGRAIEVTDATVILSSSSSMGPDEDTAQFAVKPMSMPTRELRSDARDRAVARGSHTFDGSPQKHCSQSDEGRVTLGCCAVEKGTAKESRELAADGDINVDDSQVIDMVRFDGTDGVSVMRSAPARSRARRNWATALSKVRAGLTFKNAGERFRQSSLQYDRITLHDFEKIRPIGEGGSSVVFLVRLRVTGKLFAMKVQRKKDHMEGRKADRVSTERDIMIACNHPFIAHLHFAFQSHGSLYFITEYCRGGSLADVLEHFGGSISEDEARFYCAEIVLALEYVHTLGYVYRDLKPQNVLLHESGHIRLTDFGIAERGELKQSPAGAAGSGLSTRRRALLGGGASPRMASVKPRRSRSKRKQGSRAAVQSTADDAPREIASEPPSPLTPLPPATLPTEDTAAAGDAGGASMQACARPDKNRRWSINPFRRNRPHGRCNDGGPSATTSLARAKSDMGLCTAPVRPRVSFKSECQPQAADGDQAADDPADARRRSSSAGDQPAVSALRRKRRGSGDGRQSRASLRAGDSLTRRGFKEERKGRGGGDVNTQLELRSSSFVGTIDYMAPEVVRGNTLGVGVDWWALGCVLYEMVVGQPPFGVPSTVDGATRVTFMKILGAKPRFSKAVSTNFKHLVAALLDKDVSKRLGCERGAIELKNHKWFRSIHWALIHHRPPPIVPDAKMDRFLEARGIDTPQKPLRWTWGAAGSSSADEDTCATEYQMDLSPSVSKAAARHADASDGSVDKMVLSPRSEMERVKAMLDPSRKSKSARAPRKHRQRDSFSEWLHCRTLMEQAASVAKEYREQVASVPALVEEAGAEVSAATACPRPNAGDEGEADRLSDDAPTLVLSRNASEDGGAKGEGRIAQFKSGHGLSVAVSSSSVGAIGLSPRVCGEESQPSVDESSSVRKRSSSGPNSVSAELRIAMHRLDSDPQNPFRNFHYASPTAAGQLRGVEQCETRSVPSSPTRIQPPSEAPQLGRARSQVSQR